MCHKQWIGFLINLLSYPYQSLYKLWNATFTSLQFSWLIDKFFCVSYTGLSDYVQVQAIDCYNYLLFCVMHGYIYYLEWLIVTITSLGYFLLH